MICSCTFSQFRRQPNCTLHTHFLCVCTHTVWLQGGAGGDGSPPWDCLHKTSDTSPNYREQILTLNYLTHLGIFKPSPQNNPFSEALQGTWVRNLDSCVDAFGLEGYFPSHPQTHVRSTIIKHTNTEFNMLGYTMSV